MTDEYPEDTEILKLLTDPVDAEAFENLMENAHGKGKSAVDLVREEPGMTSRKTIRKLCLKDKPKFFSRLIGAFFRRGRRGADQLDGGAY